jgi:hypothetical protein
VTDIGNITGYTYVIIAVQYHDSGDDVVCVTADLSHAEQVAEYLCTVVSLIKRGIDVTLSEDIDHNHIHKYVEKIRIHRVPCLSVILGSDPHQDQDAQSDPLFAKCNSDLPIET